MPQIRKVYWLWLALGTALFAYGVSTGGGPVGWLLYLQLRAVDLVFPATHIFLAVPLIFAPIMLLAQDSDRRRTWPIDVAASAKRLGKWFTIAGLVLATASALCYWQTTFLPAPGGTPQRIVLDELPAGGAVPERWSAIVGKPQRAYAVRYGEAMTGRFRTGSWPHNFVPITPSAWTPDQPVHFLADTRGASTSSFFSADNRRGLLLRGQLPGFVRMALRQRGLVIAPNVMVLSTDRDFGRTGWYVVTAFSAIGAFIGLAFGWAWPRARSRSQQELEALRPRVLRYLAYGVGGVLILLSGILAAQKVIHIAGAESAEGVITGVQVSHHSIGKYSFYIEYETPEGRFHRFARTWTPFAKAVGDKVRVIYSAGAPREPEIVAFDDSWAAYAILFVPGAVIVIAAAVFLRSRPATMAYIRRN